MDGRAEMARRETHQPGATTDIQKPKPLESVQLQHFPQRCLRREDAGLVQGTQKVHPVRPEGKPNAAFHIGLRDHWANLRDASARMQMAAYVLFFCM